VTSGLTRARRWRAAFVLAGVLAVVVGSVLVVPEFGEPQLRLTAHFDRVVGLYVGSDVRILGVKIGEVTAITPTGDDVRVQMRYSTRYRIPADAQAVLVPPSLVSDRYVQFTPATDTGPVLPDNADVPLDRTSAPLETDEVYRALNDFLAALGPNGANASGAFSDLIRTGRAALQGNGENLRQTLDGLSTVAAALADKRADLFTTLDNLQKFTTMLASVDAQLRSLNVQLASVAGQLASDRQVLAAMLHDLNQALTAITSFVQNNRAALKSDVDGLADITTTIAQQQKALITIFDTAPLTVSNLVLAYNAQTANLDLRPNLIITLSGAAAPATAPAVPGVADGADPTLGGILGGSTAAGDAAVGGTR
jgi:phospholipid/cholesterol/gamma-HCH transport system substrate-binding protein